MSRILVDEAKKAYGRFFRMKTEGVQVVISEMLGDPDTRVSTYADDYTAYKCFEDAYAAGQKRLKEAPWESPEEVSALDHLITVETRNLLDLVDTGPENDSDMSSGLPSLKLPKILDVGQPVYLVEPKMVLGDATIEANIHTVTKRSFVRVGEFVEGHDSRWIQDFSLLVPYSLNNHDIFFHQSERALSDKFARSTEGFDKAPDVCFSREGVGHFVDSTLRKRFERKHSNALEELQTCRSDPDKTRNQIWDAEENVARCRKYVKAIDDFDVGQVPNLPDGPV